MENLIVGAGPAGLVSGILLRRLNLSTLILERKSGIQRSVCGEYLSPQGVRWLTDHHLGSVLEGFQIVRGMLLCSPNGREVVAEFPNQCYGRSVNRKILQERLLREYRLLGGEIEFSSTLLRVEKDMSGYVVNTEAQIFHGRRLIGADGRSSHLAKLLLMQERRPSRRRLALHCYLKPLVELAPYGQMHIFSDGSYAGVNPISPAEVNFSVVCDADQIKNLGGAKSALNQWISRSRSLSKTFGPITDETITTAFPLSRQPLELWKDDAGLIGDAAGFIDPLTGEGMTTAFKTASILVDELGRAPLPSQPLQRYSKRRQHDFRQKETLNRALQIVISQPWLCEVLGWCFSRSALVSSVFIGVIGNVYTPLQAPGVVVMGMFKRLVMSLCSACSLGRNDPRGNQSGDHNG